MLPDIRTEDLAKGVLSGSRSIYVVLPAELDSLVVTPLFLEFFNVLHCFEGW